ncbi:MAG: MarR family transcriptional regulator [Crenarchaeota archaeon]|nr:MAG: MarR family transcriptional regulator [Thermoproteota archaeon]RDJ34451.1 MAG: MarR family transcriptional regulator [Thermoproteota archaeon]RDJ34789.1 MAG: MarR family transcriptional regulator [Thermoproteota archaeon]RDJ38610.1 MAG: MarR family transcriptional regulator [Thermoproteota archaeon]
MLVEIPDPEVILSGIVAFLVGLFGLYLYYKIRPYVNLKKNTLDPSYVERLEYYERQLIDMKIRMDAIDMESLSVKMPESSPQIKDFSKNTQQDVPKPEPVVDIKPASHQKQEITPNLPHGDVTEYVLKLITSKPMTSRDIQVTIDRTREHTSRLMKKLFDDGYVDRNTNTKPYTYSITPKGKERISVLENNPTVV